MLQLNIKLHFPCWKFTMSKCEICLLKITLRVDFRCGRILKKEPSMFRISNVSLFKA